MVSIPKDIHFNIEFPVSAVFIIVAYTPSLLTGQVDAQSPHPQAPLYPMTVPVQKEELGLNPGIYIIRFNFICQLDKAYHAMGYGKEPPPSDLKLRVSIEGDDVEREIYGQVDIPGCHRFTGKTWTHFLPQGNVDALVEVTSQLSLASKLPADIV